MNCKEFNQLFAELDDQTALPPALQEHRQACAACAAMVDDFALIARQAHVLRPMQAPGEQVWNNIQAALIAEGVIHAGQPALDGAGAPAIRGGIMPPPVSRRAPMGLAYAAMFLLATGMMYVHSLFTGAGAPPMIVARPQLPAIPMRDALTTASEPNPADKLARVAEAQLASTNVSGMVERVPEEHRATFVSSWTREQDSIIELMNQVRAYPDDPFLQMQLINALNRQRMLQETSSRWNDQ